MTAEICARSLRPSAVIDRRYISPKIFRTAAESRCQIKQVKAIRAAARFSYLLFLLRALPESFFWHLRSPRGQRFREFFVGIAL
jgi:hypothetical protein